MVLKARHFAHAGKQSIYTSEVKSELPDMLKMLADSFAKCASDLAQCYMEDKVTTGQKLVMQAGVAFAHCLQSQTGITGESSRNLIHALNLTQLE